MIDIGADLQRAFDEGYEKGKADRPQGEWICKGDWAECSLCGADSGTIMDGLERVPRYTRFCPECGARMKGADNE